ncbi:MAG: PorV/PorQ family protein [bacterium]
MNKTLLSIIISFLILPPLMINPAFAGSTGTSGAIVLRYPVGARAVGMGEAFTAISDDVSAVYWNPAGLSFLTQNELLMFYLEGLSDTGYGFVGFASPTKFGTLAVSITSLQAGKAKIYSLTEPTREVIAQSDYVGIISYANRIVEPLSIGLNVKVMQSELAEQEKASAYAFDVGLLYETPLKNLFFGAVMQNSGSKIKYISEEDPLPVTSRVGLAYTIFIKGKIEKEESIFEQYFPNFEEKPQSPSVIHAITIAADAEKPNDEDSRSNVGIEYWFGDIFALRSGYKIGRDAEGLTAGIGFAYSGVEFDYAYAPVKDLDSNHRVSLLVRF